MDIVSRRKTLKQVLKTSIPAVIDLSSQTITWLIETIMIGQISVAAIGSVGLCHQIILLTFTVLLTFIVGSSIIVTRYLGVGDTWNANHILGQSLFIGFIFSIIIGLIWYFGAPLLFSLIREEEPIARQYGIQYITTIALFTPLIVTNFMALGILRGAGDTLVTMKINLIVNILYLLLDAILIFGLLGFPRLETLGAGLAGGIAHSTGCILTLIVLRSRKASLFLAVMEITRPKLETFKRLIKIGVPTTVEQLVWSLGQLVMSIYAGWIGVVVLATHQVFVRIQAVITMVFFGFSLGSMTLVGKNLGAELKRQARRTGRVTGLLGLIAGLCIALLFYLGSEHILSIFTSDSSVINQGKSLILIFALLQLPKGANIVYSGSLRGSADLNWLMWLAVVTAIGYEIIGSWVLAIPLGFGLKGLWLIQGIDETTRLSLNYWRFNRGKWFKFDIMNKQNK